MHHSKERYGGDVPFSSHYARAHKMLTFIISDVYLNQLAKAVSARIIRSKIVIFPLYLTKCFGGDTLGLD